MPKLRDGKKKNGLMGMFFTSRESSGSESASENEGSKAKPAKHTKEPRELSKAEVKEEERLTKAAKRAHRMAMEKNRELREQRLLELQRMQDQMQRNAAKSGFVPTPPTAEKKSAAIRNFEARIQREIKHYSRDAEKLDKIEALEKEFKAYAETDAAKQAHSFPDFENRLADITRPGRKVRFE